VKRQKAKASNKSKTSRLKAKCSTISTTDCTSHRDGDTGKLRFIDWTLGRLLQNGDVQSHCSVWNLSPRIQERVFKKSRSKQRYPQFSFDISFSGLRRCLTFATSRFSSASSTCPEASQPLETVYRIILLNVSWIRSNNRKKRVERDGQNKVTSGKLNLHWKPGPPLGYPLMLACFIFDGTSYKTDHIIFLSAHV
jgi:hypothetical protein